MPLFRDAPHHEGWPTAYLARRKDNRRGRHPSFVRVADNPRAIGTCLNSQVIGNVPVASSLLSIALLEVAVGGKGGQCSMAGINSCCMAFTEAKRCLRSLARHFCNTLSNCSTSAASPVR